MPEQFIPGQRWISNTEADLGLGAITRLEGRTVTVQFPASGEVRTYARDNAPLTRASFSVGDWIETEEGQRLRIDQIHERDGLLHYQGHDPEGRTLSCAEGSLSPHLQLSRPHQRLLSGQLDSNSFFELRLQTRTHLQRINSSHLLGLGGARTELLPHQLYIAHEASRRAAPRVLLADEVGLGKTIEACLILHQQLLTGRASRVLIMVPEPLLHQWLVELLRRFNLQFSIFDEERCQAIEASGQAENPFSAEQLVLCSTSLFSQSAKRLAQVLDGEWDLLIVDEAHHLEWSETGASMEYQLVEALATKTPGVLLLTATPEQLGRSGHFARLRLLDPDRFHSLAQFEQEEAQYGPIAEAVDLLLAGKPLPQEASRHLLTTLHEEASQHHIDCWNDPGASTGKRAAARDALIEMLLDRHGTSRILFRNTRKRIKGFPKRELHTYPQPLPEQYEPYLQEAGVNVGATLTPEALYRSCPGVAWWRFDPRVRWLINILRRLAGEKLLLICAQAATALELGEALKSLEGINAGLFHEGMSIIERDRTAAWFADPEEGCQLLICSEIGSEGRNFQFAHHMVLFDLPLNPDLLEQRIGRLDRIGQKENIRIHIPFFEGSAQETLLRWYNEGLDAFSRSSTIGQSLFKQLGPALLQAMEENREDPEQIDLLIETTRALRQETEERINRGRDHLLEINSCREPEATAIKQELESSADAQTLMDYAHRLFALLGVDTEEHSPGSSILKPGSNMITDSLPGLPAGGLTGTFLREVALSHEDRQFLTWEHPLIRGSMELVTDMELGNSCMVAIKLPSLKRGALLMELLFHLECAAPKQLQAGRFLPVTNIRILLDQELKPRHEEIGHQTLNAAVQPLKKGTARQIIGALKRHISAMTERAECLAEEQGAALIQSATNAMTEYYASESERLSALQKVNPNIRDDEIAFLRQQASLLEHHLGSARVRLDAIRLMVSL